MNEQRNDKVPKILEQILWTTILPTTSTKYFVSTECSKYPQYTLPTSKLRKVEDSKRAKQSRENHAIFSGSHERAEFRFDFANVAGISAP